ncbi:MAG: hypothetical protein ACLQPD_35945 [Desulfomonilaceae bacterium]
MMGKTAEDFIKDVASGMTDEDLQKKYRVSGRKFTLYKATALDIIAKNKRKNPGKRKLKAQDFLKDVKRGMSDNELMGKYLLSRRALQSALRQLIELRLATPLELSNRLSITKSHVREAFVEMGKAIKELD